MQSSVHRSGTGAAPRRAGLVWIMTRRCYLVALVSLTVEATAAAQPGAPPPGPAPATPTATPIDDAPRAAPRPASSSEPTVVVAGRVIDALGNPIAGAQVSVEGGATRATTDRDGRFRIPARTSATLTVERDGYDAALATVTGDALGDVVLLAVGAGAETIEVRGEPPAAAPGAAVLDRGELQRIPGAGGDVVRALTAMPGVVNLQVPLGYNGVVIRGSSP